MPSCAGFDRSEAEPLIYHGGRYGRLMPAESAALDPQDHAQLVVAGLIREHGGEWRLTEMGRAQLALLRRIED